MAGRWGAGLTAEKMARTERMQQFHQRYREADVLLVYCRWLKPVLVGQFEFVEWTADAHLRHSRFVALREDKKATEIGRE